MPVRGGRGRREAVGRAPARLRPLDWIRRRCAESITTSPATRSALGGVTAVGGAVREGRAVLVSGGADGVLRVWDRETREEVGAVAAHDGAVVSVAATEVAGRPVLLTAGDRTLRLWDLSTLEAVGEPMRGHLSQVNAAAVGQLDGTPVAVSAGEDRTVRVWDLTTGTQRGGPLIGHEGAVQAVAVGEVEGVPAALSGSGDPERDVRLWDLRTGEQVGDPVTRHRFGIRSVAIADLDGVPVAVSASLSIDVSNIGLEEGKAPGDGG